MKIIIFIILVFTNLLAFAQQGRPNRDEVQKQIEEIMRHRDEMLKSLLNDDSFNDMEKRMQEMMKRFGADDFDFNAESFFGGSVVGQYDWKEDEVYKILSLKVKQIKDQPLDIKIEKGQIKIKGEVEESDANGNLKKGKKETKKVFSKIHFERIFSIPSGVDEKNPEFENRDGELLIKFKKLKKGMSKNFNVKNKESKKEAVVPDSSNEDERAPISPDDKDIKF